MALVLDATVGGAASNSYLTVAEADAYWESRLFTAAWDDSASKAAALVWATRTIDALVGGFRYLVPASGSIAAYYRCLPAWTGAATSATQALAWPRTGMLDRNGNAILSTVIPQAIKDAVAELAGQLSASDLTANNAIAVQGITSIKAGPVSLTFKDTIEMTRVLPDSVLFLMVASWLTDGCVEPAFVALFDVI